MMILAKARDVGLGSLFKYGYLANLCLFLPMSLIFGLSGLAGSGGVYRNGQAVHGLEALTTAIALGVLMPLAPALWLLLGSLALRLAGRRGPALRVSTPDRAAHSD